ncbi:PilX N-terminal domain-containing pilus assembly protein [Dyella sp. C9]|uniref:PilX N-terminal domain-containing pilus assembly protein n=1 Tax=Dyella sp. C9 TaxID=2202154 RepID=UPI0018E537C6|nr:PilX N-terminal domain-containing pilus assembly protein [Dyella sp. C9]
MRMLNNKDACTAMRGKSVDRGQRGVALFMGMMLLLVLTLVALVAMRSTLLDMRVTSSTATHQQAFESSEAAREVPEALLTAYGYYHGWPESWGGTIPDAQYQLSSTFLNRPNWLNQLKPNGSTGLQTSCNGALANFILNVPCIPGQTDAYNYTPSQWATTFIMDTCTDGSPAPCASANLQVVNAVAIVRDGVSTNAGSGAAAQQGYASIGVGSARGGALLMLQIRSSSVVAGTSQAVTTAQYRLNIVN